MSHGPDTDFALHFRRLVLTAAYRDATERARQHLAKGHPIRARRAQREAEDLQQRLEDIGGLAPAENHVAARIADYVNHSASP